MSIGLLFWVIMVIVLLFGFARRMPAFSQYGRGWDWLLCILLFLLGWHDFWFIIHQ